MADIPKVVQIRRNITKKSIEMDPAEIVIQRPTKSAGEAGGFDTDAEPVELPPQTVKIYTQGRLWMIEEESTVGGQSQALMWSCLAEHDADIQRGDSFTWLGKRLVVKFRRPQTTLGYVVSLQVEMEEVMVS